MKKILLIAFAITCLGCDGKNDDGSGYINCGVDLFLVVENVTDKEISIMPGMISYMYHEPTVIASGKSEIIWVLGSVSYCEPTDIDDLYPSDYSFRDDRPFAMTVDGEIISEDIWVRKHWTTKSDDDYLYYYVLVVTDELLASMES